MYPLHPATVHFPIGLLLASSLFTLIAVRSGGAAWATSAYHCLLVGWLGGVLALLTGTFDAVRQLTDPALPRDNALIGWVNAHAASNLVAVAVYGQALLRRRRNPAILDQPQGRGPYLRLHLIGALALIVGGWIGGHLVYGLKMGV